MCLLDPHTTMNPIASPSSNKASSVYPFLILHYCIVCIFPTEKLCLRSCRFEFLPALPPVVSPGGGGEFAPLSKVDMDDSALHYTVTPGEKSRTDCHRRRRINVIGGDRYRTRRILCPSNFQLLLIILVRIGSLHSSLFRTMATLFFRNSVTRRGDLCISFMYCF